MQKSSFSTSNNHTYRWVAFFVAAMLLPARAWGQSDADFERQLREREARKIERDRILLLCDELARRDDLSGEISATRPLKAEDLALLLKLSNYLIDHENDEVGARGPAAIALGRLGHVYGMPALLAVIRDENADGGTRVRCIAGLSMIRNPRAVDYLIEDGLGMDPSLDHQTIIDIVQFVGRPPELADSSFAMGVRPPPKDPAERKAYLDIWRKWWDQKRKTAKLTRSYRGVY